MDCIFASNIQSIHSPTVMKSSDHDTTTSPSIVPGIQTYSRAHENLISIVSDSMTNGMKQRDFNEALPVGRAIFKKFHGATAPEIKDYAATTIRNDSPKGILIVAGANDVSFKSRNKQTPNVQAIARDIIEIGLDSRKRGVKNIFISGLIVRKGLHVDRVRRKVNSCLYEMCLENMFYYVNNDNIGVDDLWEDGLHLNRDGSAIFQSNLMRCFDESLYIF